MAILWLLLGAVLVVIGSVFYAQNPQSVFVSLWVWGRYSVPLWLIAVGPAVVGLLLGILFSVPGRVRAAFSARRYAGQLQERDRTIGKLQERINEIERDLAVARAAPRAAITEEHRLPDIPESDVETTTTRTETHAA